MDTKNKHVLIVSINFQLSKILLIISILSQTLNTTISNHTKEHRSYKKFFKCCNFGQILKHHGNDSTTNHSCIDENKNIVDLEILIKQHSRALAQFDMVVGNPCEK